MISLTIVVAILLLIVAVLDYKTKSVPSVFLTGIILLVATVNLSEVTFGMIHLTFGAIAFIYAYLLYEFDFIGGVADIKVITIIGMMIANVPFLLYLIALVVVLGSLYKFILLAKGGEFNSEIPFIPILFMIFLILWVFRGLI